MPIRPISAESKQQIIELINQGAPRDRIREITGCGSKTWEKIRLELSKQATPPVIADKKEGSFDWREACTAVKAMQDLKKKMSWSQDEASIQLGNGTDP